MTTPRTINGTSQKILWWIVGSLFAITMAGGTFGLSTLAGKVEENSKLTTQHEVKIGGIEDDIEEIKSLIKEVNNNLNGFMKDRYGFTPKFSPES